MPEMDSWKQAIDQSGEPTDMVAVIFMRPQSRF
jgi:hypothetical protein